tara:strand:+ start:644 stop:1669 length:1026 start_codon:yes stop_codon:yes gene_type:complete
MACWDGYKQVGMKKKGDKMVPNCVPISEIVKLAKENICVNCGNITTENILDEDLRKWFKQKWVNIGKKDKSGKHPPCGTSGKKRGYAKCVPASKARGMSKKEKESATRRKRAAQNKAGRGGTSDISGGGKKPIRVKTKAESVMNVSKEKLKEMIRAEYQNILSENNMMTEEQFDEAAGKKDACYHKVKARYDVWPSAYASGALSKCRKVGAKNWGNKSKKKESIEEYDVENYQDYKEFVSYMKETYGTMKESQLEEAEYQGRKVKLGKPMQGDTKKFKVYVKNPKGNVVKVNFGHGGSSVKGKSMRIRKSNPDARRSFRARHNCDSPGPRHKARYWSCKKW